MPNKFLPQTYRSIDQEILAVQSMATLRAAVQIFRSNVNPQRSALHWRGSGQRCEVSRLGRIYRTRGSRGWGRIPFAIVPDMLFANLKGGAKPVAHLNDLRREEKAIFFIVKCTSMQCSFFFKKNISAISDGRRCQGVNEKTFKRNIQHREANCPSKWDWHCMVWLTKIRAYRK